MSKLRFLLCLKCLLSHLVDVSVVVHLFSMRPTLALAPRKPSVPRGNSLGPAVVHYFGSMHWDSVTGRGPAQSGIQQRASNTIPIGQVSGTRLAHISSSSMSTSSDVDTDTEDLDDDIPVFREEETSDDSALSDIDLPPGIPNGFFVVKHYTTPETGFDLLAAPPDVLETDKFERLGLSPSNVTLPVVLMMLDPDAYPSLSRARKACRKGTILIHRGVLGRNQQTGERSLFDPEKCIRGRVGDRVYPGDVVAKQVRMGDGRYAAPSYKDPPFELPVVYEDDHFAIVNKPAGIVVYSHRGGGHGRNSVRSALPFALEAPRVGTYSVMRRPMAVHRLDRPTSGLLLVAKTKPAMIHLAQQFVARKVQKTYTAIVNGIPDEPVETSISAETAFSMGMDVDPNDHSRWQLIDFTLDERHAITAWRPLQYTKSLKAKDETLTLVELKPKTGRKHQLRRHMAWVCDSPLVGDKLYDGGGDAMSLRGSGLFLCSNRVKLEHPYFNTEAGRRDWNMLKDEKKYANGMLYQSDEGTVMVSASIDLPSKFGHLLGWEEERAIKFADEDKN